MLRRRCIGRHVTTLGLLRDGPRGAAVRGHLPHPRQQAQHPFSEIPVAITAQPPGCAAAGAPPSLPGRSPNPTLHPRPPNEAESSTRAVTNRPGRRHARPSGPPQPPGWPPKPPEPAMGHGHPPCCDGVGACPRHPGCRGMHGVPQHLPGRPERGAHGQDPRNKRPQRGANRCELRLPVRGAPATAGTPTCGATRSLGRHAAGKHRASSNAPPPPWAPRRPTTRCEAHPRGQVGGPATSRAGSCHRLADILGTRDQQSDKP